MKKFKDLKVGDTILIGFEEKTITDIVLGDKYALISTKEQKVGVLMDSYYDYDSTYKKVVSVNKKALVDCFENGLKALRTFYDKQKDYLEKMIEKANKLEYHNEKAQEAPEEQE